MQKAAQVVVVAVTSLYSRIDISTSTLKAALCICVVCSTLSGAAAVLPEDRADLMYHSYDGGGVKVDGPSLLVRKSYENKLSVWANYYIDMISSASIDVLSTASPYNEERA